MPFIHIAASVIALFLGLIIGVTAHAQEPCFLPGYQERAVCHTIEVPEDRLDPDGRKIDLFVAVVPAKAPSPEADPFVILAGGPGEAAAELAAFVEPAFGEVLERRDIILMDRRGTGKSNPLECAFIDENATNIDLELVAQSARACLDDYEADVRHYSAPDVIEDLETVRETLGVDSWNLWGGSYGTRTGLLYLRAYPERVRTLTIDAVAGPQDNLFLSEPAGSQGSLDRWNEVYPGLRDRLNALIAAHKPAKTYRYRDPVSGEWQEGPVDADTIAGMVRGILYSPAIARQLPLLLDELEAGNLGPLSAAATNFGGAVDGMYFGATLATQCREDVSRLRDSDLARATAEGFTGDLWASLFKAACRYWPMKPLPADYGDPVISDVPVLLISGGLDPVTPPSNAEAVAQHLTNKIHLVVTDGGHINSATRCMPKAIAQFVKSADPATVEADCLDMPMPAPITALTGPQL